MSAAATYRPGRWLAVGLLAAACAALWSAPLAAQNSRIPFERLTIQEGLAHDTVNALLQDRQGFLWFGTQDGLARYDGQDFVVLRNDPADPQSLVNSWVWALHQDADDQIWIGTDRGLDRYDPRTGVLVHYRNEEADPNSLSSDRIRVVYQDRRGDLWVGTDAGLNRLLPDRDGFERLVHNPSNPASLSSDQIRAVFEDRAGSLWIGTNGGGLSRWDRAQGSFTHFRHDSGDPSSISDDRVRTIFEDRDGNFWIGTYEGGLNLMDRENGTFERFQYDPFDPRSLSDNRVRCLLQDGSGELWIGTDRGLNQWNAESRTFTLHQRNIADPTSLTDNRIMSLFQDQGSVLWVGTRGGLNKWNPTTGLFAGYLADPAAPETSLSDNAVQAFAEDPSGSIWVGTYEGGLNLVDLETGRVRQYRHEPERPGSLADDRVGSLFLDSRGVLWVGTFEAGLHRFDRASGTFVNYRHDPDDPTSLARDAVTSIYEDREGVLWIGTYGGGLNRLNRDTGRFVAYRHDPEIATSLSSDKVLTMHEDRSGILWVGTDSGGLAGLDRRSGAFTRFRHDDAQPGSLSGDTVFSIHESRDGTLWLGTQGGGLNRWRLEDRAAHLPLFKSYTRRDGLANDSVYGILEDEEGYLWLSTNEGLSRFDPRAETFRNFDDSNGLQSKEFNFGAYFKSSRGEMFFGSNQGFNSFFPSSIQTNTHVPSVLLTRVLKFNREVDLGGPAWALDALSLSYKDYVVSFEFAALDFTAPEKNLYAYKLEGFDAEWNELGTLNRATYTNLDPGNYVLRIKGSNNDGVWNESGVRLPIRVVPPIWANRWAYLLYALAAVAMALVYLRAQKRERLREVARRRELEREVRERTSELAERNEDLERANMRLEQASVTDSLTGLWNRRFLINNIEHDLALVDRQHADPDVDRDSKAHYLFLIFDIDGFKRVNDSYGHAAGDRVLLQVRDLLEAACRKSDRIIRWGGDEFLVVARHTDRGAAVRLAERLRASVENHRFDLGLGHSEGLTCSIGFAYYPFLSFAPRMLNWEQVGAVADRALYIAKKSGRNAWVGISETARTREVDASQLVALINREIDALVAEGKLKLATSIEDRESLTWAWA